jgi:hypothetical protein
MTTTVRARRIPGQQVTISAPTPEAAQEAARTPAGPRRDWPRPPLVHDHRQLFVEPAYEGGQPYADDDDLEDDEPAG